MVPSTKRQKDYYDRPLSQWPLYQVHERLLRYQKQLQKELRAKGIVFDFHLWVSEEWFCPDGVPGFALPFYLFNPELKEIHRQQTGEVEGDTDSEILKLMRHELAHAIDNAFRLRLCSKRQKIFGCSSQDYPTYYQPKPYSKSFVYYLSDQYGQSHPDEDFAETLAYWLDPSKKTPKSGVSKTRDAKYNYLRKRMQELRGQRQILKNKYRIDPIEKNQMTLHSFYSRFHSQRDTQGLRQITQSVAHKILKNKGRGKIGWQKQLRTHQQSLVQSVAKQESAHRYQVKKAFDLLLQQAERLEIRGSKTAFHRHAPLILHSTYRYLKEKDQLRVYL